MTATAAEETPVPGLDPAASARWMRRSVPDSPWLHEEVGARMADRLQWFREPPRSWLHWEPLNGGVQTHRRLRERLPAAPCWVASERPLDAQAATAESPPATWNPLRRRTPVTPPVWQPGQGVGMVWANMLLHAVPQPAALIRQWHSAIDVGGFLMFSCHGPDSLKELRAVYDRLGWPAPAHAFTDMHDWGDMLVHAGFAEPVMDMERLVLTYSSGDALLDELRGLGRNLASARATATRGRAWRARLVQALESGLPRQPDGRLTLTMEIVYGHAFKPQPRVPVATSSRVGLDDMRAMLRGTRR